MKLLDPLFEFNPWMTLDNRPSSPWASDELAFGHEIVQTGDVAAAGGLCLHAVVAHLIVIIGILVSQRVRHDPLRDETVQPVLAALGVAMVREASREQRGHAEHDVGLRGSTAYLLHEIGDALQDIQTKVMTTLFALFVEVERDMISERTREGLARARASGKTLGRPKGSLGVSRLDGKEDEIRHFIDLGVSRSTLYNFMATRGLKPGR